MKKISVLLVVLLITSYSWAGKLSKGFDALDKYDYFKAKELFEKAIEKEPAAAAFGISTIFYRNDNPFYNLDSSYKYILVAESSYKTISEKEKDKLLKFKVDSMAIQNLKDSIDRNKYIAIKSSQKSEVFDAYYQTHLDSDYRDLAEDRRDELNFEAAKEKNTALAYQLFFVSYPNAKQVIEAKNRFEERLFVEHTSGGKAADYNYFIKKYPESPFVQAALDSVYAYYTKVKNQENYYQFIKENSKHPKVNEAWRNIYKLYTADYSPEKILEFKINYPDYPFIDDLKQDMRLAAMQFLPFKVNNQWGFMDINGKVMVEAKYNWVEPFVEGLALVVLNGKLGYINKSGEEIIPLEYEDGESFNGGFAIVSKDDLFGMIDRTNKIIIPLKYDLVGNFMSDLALVANETAYGFINKKGELSIPMNLEYATDFEKGFALVEMNGMKGMINSKGKTVIPFEYNWLEPFNNNGVCRAQKDSLFGLLNTNGGIQLEFDYDHIGEFGKGLFMVVQNGKYGYVDRIGELKIPIEFDFRREALTWGTFKKGYTKFFYKDKFGIIDSSGSKIVPAIFEDIKEYDQNNLIAVKKKGKWGFMNQNSKLIVSYKYDDAFSFYNEGGLVKEDSLWGVIDEKGKYIIESRFHSIVSFDTLGFLIEIEGKKGLLNKRFESILPNEFELIEKSDSKFILKLEKEGNVFYYNWKEAKFIYPE